MVKGLLAFDIDGTLTHRGDWIDPQVIQALKKLHDEGWQIALVTGRMFSFAQKILSYFTFPFTLAVQNGADILEMPSQKVLKRYYISSWILPKIEEAYVGIEGDFIIYSGIDEGDFCYFRPHRFCEKKLKYLRILENLGKTSWRKSNFEFESRSSFSLIKCFGDPSSMEELQMRLQKNSEIEISMIHDPIDRAYYLNLITHPNANKGHVIQFLRTFYNADCVIAAGDDRNDLKMIQEADIGIAIQTAPEEVLASAKIHAKPPQELGIIHAIDQAIAMIESLA